MALSVYAAARRYTYADLANFPDDHIRREIIDGKLVVNPSPTIRHQIASGEILFRLMTYAREHGGLALAAPTDVVFSEANVVVPDLVFVRSDHLDLVGSQYIQGPPDLAVEISSPSTRRLELVRKRELYGRFGIPEYWFVDLDAERIEIYLLTDGIYATPQLRYPGELLESTQLPGFSMPVNEALPPKPPGADPG